MQTSHLACRKQASPEKASFNLGLQRKLSANISDSGCHAACAWHGIEAMLVPTITRMYKTVAQLQVAEDIFIDASTGRCYPIPSSPFLGIESMWNHDNYWVCMQMPEPHSDSRATPQHLSLDVTDASKWEYMLPTALPQVNVCDTGISMCNCYQSHAVLHYSCPMMSAAVLYRQ